MQAYMRRLRYSLSPCQIVCWLAQVSCSTRRRSLVQVQYGPFDDPGRQKMTAGVLLCLNKHFCSVGW